MATTDPIAALAEITPTTVELPEKMQKEAVSYQNAATGLQVKTPEDVATAIEWQKVIRARIKDLQEFFTSIKRPLEAAKKAVLDKEKAAIGPYQTADSHLDREVTNFRIEERRIAELKRREAEQEARKTIEENRKREAAAAEAKGKTKLAEAIRTAPIDVPKVEVQTTDFAGTRKTVNYKFRITDAGLIPREFMQPNEVEIGYYVRREKEKALPGGEKAIPGIEVTTDEHTRPS
jgi:hypothetical protein